MTTPDLVTTPMNFPWQELGGLGAVATGSLCIGLLINGSRPEPLPLIYRSPQDRLVQSVQRLSAQVSSLGQRRTIGLEELQDRVATHRGAIVDARPAVFFRAGHIPGALSLPRKDFEIAYPNVRTLLGPDFASGIVVYCSGSDCEDSEMIADALTRLGWQTVYVYKEGWEEWSQAGLPHEKAAKAR